MGNEDIEITGSERPKFSVIDLSKRARQRLRSRRFSEARDLFASGLEIEPENPYLLSGMGDACREMQDYRRAEECYGTLLEIEPHNLFALRGLGDVYKKQERHQNAIELWTRYLVLRPQDKHVMTRIADSHKAMQQFDSAEHVYKDILAIAPSDRYALTGLADLQHRLGKDELAISTYERVLEFDDRELHILTIVGKLCWRICDFERAEEFFRRALNVDPVNPYALYGLGNCFRWNRQYEKALATWMEILKTSEGTQALHTRMGDAYYNLGRFAEAEASYLKSLNFGKDPFSTAGLVCLFSELENWNESLGYFWQLVEDEDELPARIELLAKRYVRAGQRDTMLELFKRVVTTEGLSAAVCAEVKVHLGHLK